MAENATIAAGFVRSCAHLAMRAFSFALRATFSVAFVCVIVCVVSIGVFAVAIFPFSFPTRAISEFAFAFSAVCAFQLF